MRADTFGTKCCWLDCEATNPPIGQALADDAAESKVTARVVINAERKAVRVAEVEVAQVALQMLRTVVLIDTAHAALKDDKKAFDRICVEGAVALASVLDARVIDR